MTDAATDREWLQRMAELEDEHGVSVGGWVTDLEREGLGSQPSPLARSAFARLVKLARRERRLSMEAFAREAAIDLTHLVGIECHEGYVPTPETVARIARCLQLPEMKLMALAGLLEGVDEPFREAAARFAARCEPVRTLTRQEREALTEFVGFLCHE